MKAWIRFLFSTIFLIPLLAACPERKVWRPIDKASLIAYLANPDMSLGTNNNGKGLVYSFYFDSSLFNDRERLDSKTNNVYYLTYRYALKGQLNFYDTMFANCFTLDEKAYRSNMCFLTKFPNNLQLSTLNKFSEVSNILFFPCKAMVGRYGKDRVLFYELDNSKCPKARSPINREEYAMALAWITKDYVVANTNKYKGVYIYYTQENGESLAGYYRFNDKDIFGDMHDHVLYHLEKKLPG